MTTESLPPPALSTLPQFTAAFWDKAPRDMNPSKVKHVVTKLIEDDETYIEFAFANGNAFMRKQSECDPEIFSKLHANMQVFVQTYQGELVTGLFVPEVGWVFKMTSQDLADYARKIVTDVQVKRSRAKAELEDFFTDQIVRGLQEQGAVDGHLDGDAFMASVDFVINVDQLAKYVMNALEHAKEQPNV